MPAAGAAAPLQRARPLDLAEVRFQAVHPPDETAPVHLELRLPRATRADATGLLAERRAAATQPRQSIAQEGELDLRLPLGAPRVLGEDVEDDGRAVDGRASEHLLEVAVLRRRQLVVEDDRVGVEAAAQLGDLLRLAPTDEGGGVGGVAPLYHPADHICTCAVHQLRELVQLLVDELRGEPGEDDADEDDPLPEGPLDERARQDVVSVRRLVSHGGISLSRQRTALETPRGVVHVILLSAAPRSVTPVSPAPWCRWGNLTGLANRQTQKLTMSTQRGLP